SGERSRAGTEGESVELAERDAGLGEQALHRVQSELRVLLPCRKMARVQRVAARYCDRAERGRRLDREQVHGRPGILSSYHHALVRGALMKKHRIAVIPGDGIGREVMPEGQRAMEAAGRRHGIEFEWKEFPWSCEWRKTHGRMMPEDALETLRGFDAIYFGACGFPGVPDHVSLWEMLIPMRREFDL